MPFFSLPPITGILLKLFLTFWKPIVTRLRSLGVILSRVLRVNKILRASRMNTKRKTSPITQVNNRESIVIIIMIKP